MRARTPILLFLLCLACSAAHADGNANARAKAGYRPDEDPNYKGTGVQQLPSNNQPSTTPVLTENPSANGPSRQADAFDLASEQGTYMQAYQMFYGPYAMSDPDRDKTLNESARTIEECMQGGCEHNRAKQQKVMKALVQYNYGQELKKYVLTNNTRREAMRSLREDANHNQYLSDDTQTPEIASTTHGSSMAGGRSAKADLAYAEASSNPAFYQMDESKIHAAIDEKEILGDVFLKNYKAFLSDYTRLDPNNKDQQARYYKYVSSRPGSENSPYVYDYGPNRLGIGKDQDALAGDPARLSEVARDQDNKNIQRTAQAYVDSLVKPEIKTKEVDGRRVADIDHLPGSDIGLGQIKRVPQIRDADGKLHAPKDRQEDFVAITRDLNQKFKDAALQKGKTDGTTRNLATSGTGASSAPATALAPNQRVDITIDPNSFDKFLDDIWPTSAQRRQRIQAADQAEQQTSRRATDQVN